MLSRLFFYISFVSTFPAVSQEVEFLRIEPPENDEHLNIESVELYSRYEFAPGIYWATGWISNGNVAGNWDGAIFKATYTDTVSDGHLIKSIFFKSNESDSNFIIVSKYGSSDDTWGMAIFEIDGQKLRFLSHLSLLVKGKDPVLGDELYFPEDFIQVFKRQREIILRFKEGEYIYDWPDQVTLKAPFEVIYNGNEFVVKHN